MKSLYFVSSPLHSFIGLMTSQSFVWLLKVTSFPAVWRLSWALLASPFIIGGRAGLSLINLRLSFFSTGLGSSDSMCGLNSLFLKGDESIFGLSDTGADKLLSFTEVFRLKTFALWIDCFNRRCRCWRCFCLRSWLWWTAEGWKGPLKTISDLLETSGTARLLLGPEARLGSCWLWGCGSLTGLDSLKCGSIRVWLPDPSWLIRNGDSSCCWSRARSRCEKFWAMRLNRSWSLRRTWWMPSSLTAILTSPLIWMVMWYSLLLHISYSQRMEPWYRTRLIAETARSIRNEWASSLAVSAHDNWVLSV